jgi:hypothetical protein
MAMEAVAMMIRTGSLGEVEYVYSDTSGYTLQDAGYDEDFDFGYEWWRLHQQPVDYVYSDTSGYGLPYQVYVTDTPVDVAYAYSDLSRYTLPGTGSQTAGGAWQTAGAQSPLTGQKMPSVTQRPPVQQQSSSGSMLLLVGAVGLGLFLGLS